MSVGKIKYYIAAMLILAIGSYWITYIDKVGLHGDEAWFGVEAASVLQNGFTRWTGSSYYSGALQFGLNALVFKIFGISIVTLRSVGIVCNTVALLLMSWFLYRKTQMNTLLFFLVLVFQSALLLTYSKVAWEVSSFSFLFFTVAAVTLYEICCRNSKREHLFVVGFLISNMLSTYNHLIFLSFMLAVHMGLLVWCFFHKQSKEIDNVVVKCYTATGLSVLNSSLLFAVMFFYRDAHSVNVGLLVFIIAVLVVLIQSYYFKVLSKNAAGILSKVVQFEFPSFMKVLILVGCAVIFVKYHVLTFYRVQSHDVIFNRLYSYRLTRWEHFVFMGVSVGLFLGGAYVLIKDVLGRSRGPWGYIIVLYLGILGVFTQGYSMRYYLVLTLLLFMYMAYMLQFESRLVQRCFFVLFLVSGFLVHSNLWTLNSDENREVKAFYFRIGKFTETSAHFLSFNPVLDTLLKHEIGQLSTTQNFFIGKVFQFYKEQYPELKTYKNTLKIEYDFNTLGTGFDISEMYSEDVMN